MDDKQTDSPFRSFARRLAVGVDRVRWLPGRVLVALANVAHRAAEAGVVPALLATVIGIWLGVCWCAAAGSVP